MKNLAVSKALLLFVLLLSFVSCETESIADEESLFIDDPVEEKDIQATRKDRIRNGDT